jgi:ATP-dependent DNA helicase RecG
LLILKNLNYKKETKKVTIKSDDKKVTIKSDDKKVTIKSDDKKVTIKTQEQYNVVLQYMVPEKEYRLEEIAEQLGVKTTRTKTVLKELIKAEKVEVIGGNRDRRYRLK